MRSALPALLTALAVLASPGLAHHSISAIYDSSEDVSLDAVVREFLFIHPHPVLVLDVGAGRERTSWRAEMDNRFELEDIGITSTTFRPGDRVLVNGDPGRSQPNILYLWKLERPADGLRYEQVGSTPRLTRGKSAD